MKTANQLPGDTLAVNLKDEIDNIWGKMHNQEDLCAACPDVRATARCFTCQLSLCEECHRSTHGEIDCDVNHTVVEYSPSVLCDQHGKDLVYVCEDCEKAVCSSCLIKGCYRHKHTTIWGAVEGYFKMREEAETNPKILQENFRDYKQEMLDIFETTTIEIREHSEWMIETIQSDTQLLIDSVNELRSESLKIFEATKAAADLLEDFSNIELPACQYEIPLKLFHNLPTLSKSEARLERKGCCSIKSLYFEDNNDISVGRVHVTLADSTPRYPIFPQLFMSYAPNARKHKHHQFADNRNEIICALIQNQGGDDNTTIEQLFAEDMP